MSYKSKEVPKKFNKKKVDYECDRTGDEKYINHNRQLLKEALTELQKSRKDAIEDRKYETRNDKPVNADDYTGILNGFLNSKNKETYLKNNKENFKKLSEIEQRKLVKIFTEHL